MKPGVTSAPLRSFHLVAVLLLSSLAFGQHAKSKGEPVPSSFVVIPGATDVARFELEGSRKQLSYRIRAEYPAQSVLATIKLKLKERGWVPLAEDYFNPGLKSSIIRGWDYYEDDATQPRTSVRVWQADWQRKGELVTYRLEYRCPDNDCASTSELRELRIVAIFTAQPDKTYRPQ